jgi:branched-chain amino acid transport system substrate-binding protein
MLISSTIQPLRFPLQLTALVCALAAAGAASAQDVQVVKIGHAGPVSGGIAHIGKDTENGVRMAVDELNTQNLVIGGKKIKFELAAEDDAGDPRQATAVAQKLCDLKVAGVVGHLQSGTSIPASSIYDKCDLPHITASATNPDLTKPGYKTTFRLIANDNALGAALALYAADHLKLKTVAIIDDRTAYGQGVAKEFEDEAKRQGLKVVSHEFTTDKATDFTAILTGLRSSKPDAVFFGGYSPQGGPMLRQMRALGLNMPLLGGDGICSTETATLSQVGGNLNVYCTQGGSMLDRSDKGQKFIERYRAEYKRDPLTYAAAFYDGMNLLASAIEATQSTDAKKLIDHIARGKYAGVSGEYSYDDKHDLRSSAVTVFTFKGKEVVPLKSL